MQMFQPLLLLVCCSTLSLAQFPGPPALPNYYPTKPPATPPPPPPSPVAPPPRPPPSPVAPTPPASVAPTPPSTSVPVPVQNYFTQCYPGELIPGPTCISFYMCVGWNNYVTRRALFQCAPGTVFAAALQTCVSGDGAVLCGSVPSPIYPIGPPISSPPAVTPEPDSCSAYELDGTGVYDCFEPGYFPSSADCSRFYQCVVTMDCIIKGFLFRCPFGYIFDTRQRKCGRISEVGECNRLLDPGMPTFEIKPIPVINSKDLDQFFGNAIYWNVMNFISAEPQKIVSISPSTFSRGVDRIFSHQETAT